MLSGKSFAFSVVDETLVLVYNGTEWRTLKEIYQEVTTAEELTTTTPAAVVDRPSNIDSTSNAVDATLAAGIYVGQTKVFVMTEASPEETSWLSFIFASEIVIYITHL